MMNKSTVWNMLNQNVPDLVEGLSIDDIMKICGIIDANSFRIDKHGTRGVFLATSMVSKVEKILKGSLDSIPSPSPSVKIQIVGGKVYMRCKGKTLVCIFVFKSLLTSPSNVLPYYLKHDLSFH